MMDRTQILHRGYIAPVSPPSSGPFQHSMLSTTKIAETPLHVPHSLQTVLDACLSLTPPRRPDPKELRETATGHVEETALALATTYESKNIPRGKPDSHQEQRPTNLKPALKPKAKTNAARVPARVHFLQQTSQVPSGARKESQGRQLPALQPGAVRLPANILFPDHARDDSMMLSLTRSEKGFNFKTASGCPVLTVRGVHPCSSNWNDTAMYMAGNRLLNLRQQGVLLWTTFSGDDPDGNEIFHIKCPATSGKPLSTPLESGLQGLTNFIAVNSLKAVGSFLNAHGAKETLVMKGDYYGRKIDIADQKTGMCVARIRQRQRGDRHQPLALSLLLVSPTVDCVLMAAMSLLAYKVIHSRTGL
ncbi:uncharacterized protein PG986_012462 [Apiospora aurea]|uniref:Tubby C-terminal domain-containing protein n=1 Tax=Apiospora aurea TaxID=335848 RepID=A0ABR1Q026_9PEZI